MNTSSPTAEPERVCATADQVIIDIMRVGFPPGLLDDLRAEPHRLSATDLGLRVRKMRRWKSSARIRAGLQQIVTELELYREGIDVGYEAGYAQALTDMAQQAEGIAS